jgi:hypothetical protein
MPRTKSSPSFGCTKRWRNALLQLTRYFSESLYYGLRGNFESIDDFYYQVTRMLYRLLNRRSQRRSYNWKGFAELIKVFKLERPHICHSF